MRPVVNVFHMDTDAALSCPIVGLAIGTESLSSVGLSNVEGMHSVCSNLEVARFILDGIRDMHAPVTESPTPSWCHPGRFPQRRAARSEGPPLSSSAAGGSSARWAPERAGAPATQKLPC